MYTGNRFPPGRGRIVAFEPRRLPGEHQDDTALSIPSPDEPDEAVQIEDGGADARLNPPISSERPLFRFLNFDIWLDDIILLVVILFLIAENNFDSILLPVLVFLFLAGLIPGL
jgi:hypothetical protein